MNITDIDRKYAQQACDAIYGSNQYTLSDDDIEMMLEFVEIKRLREMERVHLQIMEIEKRAKKNGVEW